MFDKTFLHLGGSGPSHVSVSEQRAPTDESVRLLREMESKARDSVVESLRLKNNVLDAVVHSYYDPLSDKTTFRVRYDLNGQRREVTHSVDRPAKIMEYVESLWKAIAEDMAAALIGAHGKAFTNAPLY